MALCTGRKADLFGSKKVNFVIKGGISCLGETSLEKSSELLDFPSFKGADYIFVWRVLR
jgi:hypothetical protein